MMRIKTLCVGDAVHFAREKRHIVSFCDDTKSGCSLVVYKVWAKYKNCYRYHCEPLESFLFAVALNEGYDKKKRARFFALNGVKGGMVCTE